MNSPTQLLSMVLLAGMVSMLCAVGLAQAPSQLPPRFAHVVDLTHALDESTPYIPVPNITFPFKKLPIATVAKNGVAAYRWEIHEHLGTQIDAPNHFFEQGSRSNACRSRALWRRSWSSMYRRRPKRIPIQP
jgi:Putative cyclase